LIHMPSEPTASVAFTQFFVPKMQTPHRESLDKN
jgi:hypothetical protein